MRSLMTPLCCLLALSGVAQRNNEVAIALTNTSPAFPFSTVAGFFRTPFKPGFELGYGFNWKTETRHDWYQQVKLGYFYHRFVQHGIPLYTNFGYRYKFPSPLSIEASLGAGYLHSVPATAKFKLGGDGEYTNNKGIGRMQAMVAFSLGARYVLHSKAKKDISVFINSQQRIQLPFIKSYVPLLPYNCLMIGAIVGPQK